MDAQAHLRRELAGERASALKRIATTLELLLADLARLGDHVDGSQGATRRAALEQYRQTWELASRWRWYLDVQREVLGLRSTSMVDDFYALPPRR